VGADDDVARNGRCYDTALMSLGRTMTWHETAAVFYYAALLQTRQDTRRNPRHKRSLLCPIGHNIANSVTVWAGLRLISFILGFLVLLHGALCKIISVVTPRDRSRAFLVAGPPRLSRARASLLRARCGSASPSHHHVTTSFSSSFRSSAGLHRPRSAHAHRPPCRPQRAQAPRRVLSDAPPGALSLSFLPRV